MMEGSVVDNSGSFDAPDSKDASAKNSKDKNKSGRKKNEGSECSDGFFIPDPKDASAKNSKDKNKSGRKKKEGAEGSDGFVVPDSKDASAKNSKDKNRSGRKKKEGSEGSDGFVINPPTIESLQNTKTTERKESVSSASESSLTSLDESGKKAKGKRKNRVSPESESSLTSLDDTESEKKLENRKDRVSTTSESSLTSLDETKRVKKSNKQKERYQIRIRQQEKEKEKWDEQEKALRAEIKKLQDEDLNKKCKELELQTREDTRKFKYVTEQFDATKAELQQSKNTEACLRKTTESLTDNVKTLEEECKAWKSDMSDMILKKTDLEQQLIEAKHESERTDIDIKALEKKNKELETEINKLKKEKERDIKALEKKNKDQEKEKEREVNKLQKENLELKSATNSLNKEKATLQLQIKDKDKALSAKTEENKNFVASAKCMEEEYQSKERDFNKTIKNLSDGKNKAENLVYEKQRVIEKMQTALNNHVSTIKTQISTINSLETDKKDLTLRLSKLAGANLTYNNPNIADLSDENRPTKLAEEFSELYDNEWTDAFENIAIPDEQQKTQFMLNILKRASNLCHETSQDHMTAIKSSFVSLHVRNVEAEKEEIVDENVISVTTPQGDEADADDGDPQIKPLVKAGTDNSANNNEGNPETNVTQTVVRHQLEADTLDKDTPGSLATGEHLPDHTNKKGNDNPGRLATDELLPDHNNENGSDTNRSSDTESNEHVQDRTKTADENEEDGANADDKDPLRQSITTRKSSNKTGVGEGHSANQDGYTENVDNQTGDGLQLETDSDTAGNQMTGELLPTQSGENNGNIDSSMNANAQKGETDQAQKTKMVADENANTNIEERNAHNPALKVHQADGELPLVEELGNPNGVYLNPLSDEDSTDEEPIKAIVQANEVPDNNPEGQDFSNDKTSDPKNLQTDKEEHFDSVQRDPVGTKTQTNVASKRRSRTVQTSVYTKLNDADFEKLTNEQKKIILEIRKVFEHQLSEKFHKIGTEIIVKEFQVEEQESLVKYVQKCMTICWSMCRHEPPVHIEFPDTEGDLQYDTNMFKPYTKTGKHLDFIVWPALYLHKGGPMLAKGVAQGRK